MRLLHPAWLGPLAAALLGAAPAPPPPVSSTFLFDLASATGRLPSTWARLAYDRQHAEVLVLHDGVVRIFNSSGMEVHRFGDDGDLGALAAVAPLPDGDILVLSTGEGRPRVLRCNFRGERIGEVALRELPPALEKGFAPGAMAVQAGRIYLLDPKARQVVVADLEGRFQRAVALDAVLPFDPTHREDAYVAGFGVDPAGDLLFTVPMQFAAYVVSPAGEVRRFGQRGSAPGRFNVVGAITTDEQGRLYLTDRLRCVVMVYDQGLRFLGEFGYRGEADGELVTPFDLVAGGGKVFVAQAGERGVRAFRVTFPEPAPEKPAERREGAP